jgi:hypothetical protein
MIESKTSDLRKRTIERKQNKRPKEKMSEKDKKKLDSIESEALLPCVSMRKKFIV